MTIAADLPARPLTLDDVTRIAEADTNHRFELSEGNLVVMPPGTWRHQEISACSLRGS
jgi:Uma2 family endonuclease